MLFHVWFSTKNRRDALQGAIRDSVLSGFRAVAAEKRIGLLEVEAQFDHVHMLLRVTTPAELPKTMHLLKGITSREISIEYPDMLGSMGTEAFWQKSYGRRVVREEEVEAVRRYIRTQLDRPLRH